MLKLLPLALPDFRIESTILLIQEIKQGGSNTWISKQRRTGTNLLKGLVAGTGIACVKISYFPSQKCGL